MPRASGPPHYRMLTGRDGPEALECAHSGNTRASARVGTRERVQAFLACEDIDPSIHCQGDEVGGFFHIGLADLRHGPNVVAQDYMSGCTDI
jgi:hypothetical protein